MNAPVMNKIIYLGDDAAYFRVLSGEISRLKGGTPVKLEQLYEQTPGRIQGLLPRVLELKPKVIFVDFSKHTDDYVHLARLLTRTNTLNPFSIIGLHDYLSPPNQMRESVLTGVRMNHIKSAEVFDPAFAALVLLTPDKERRHGFASAEFEEKVIAQHLCKVGYVYPEGLHVETDLHLAPGTKLNLHHHWLEQKLMPAGLATVRSSTQEFLFYSFPYAADLSFDWTAPVTPHEGDSPERIRELEDERQHAEVKAKKAMKAWVDDNLDRSQNKSVRVLVVDRPFSFYNDRERSDRYGYAIRCQPFLADVAKELGAQHPQVIAISLDPAPGAEGKEIVGPVNDLELVRKVVAVAKQKFPQHLPYLIVFNLKEKTSKELQQQLDYTHCMAYAGELTPEVLLKMADLFAGKIKYVHAGPDSAHTVFVKKSNPISIVGIDEEVKLLRLSESDAVLSSSRKLSPGMSLQFTTPFQGILTITAHPQHTKDDSYYALVNGIGEEEKKALRRYVNQLFFKDHDAEKRAELETFQQLNQAKWEEQLKAEAEAAEKLEAEAAAASAQKSDPSGTAGAA